MSTTTAPRSREQILQMCAARLIVPVPDEDGIVNIGPEELEIAGDEEFEAFCSITEAEIWAAAAEFEAACVAEMELAEDDWATDDRPWPIQSRTEVIAARRRRLTYFRSMAGLPSVVIVPPSVEVVAHAARQPAPRSREGRQTRRRRGSSRAGPDSDEPEPPARRRSWRDRLAHLAAGWWWL